MGSSDMGISFTEEQQSVIDARDCSLLVSAAAGSGKTAVLVERIVRLISEGEHPADIDRLLIVTFTNAAAAQMRERIRDALGKKLETDPENTHLQRQMTLLHNAQITTIDSFCLFVIRNHFNDISLDPAFRVADEGELKLLRGDVMEAFLEDCFAAQDEAFLNCLESMNQNGDERTLAEQIQQLYDFARSYPFPELWLKRAAEDCTFADWEAVERTPWAEFAKADIERMLSACAERLSWALTVCEQPDGPYMYAPLLEAERDKILSCLGQETLSGYAACAGGITFGRLPSKKDESVLIEKRELVKGVRSEVKAVIEKLTGLYFFLPKEELLSDLQKSAETVKELILLTLSFGERLQAKKREKNILDFGDMEHYALEILLQVSDDGSFVPSKAAQDYREYFTEIMIDEYQDSNLVQEYILQSISGEAEGRYNRFMVGDVKQSIYKFRLARPELFMEKYERYATEGTERKILLHRNFRSRREVTDSVNHVFERIMKRELGGIAYDKEAALFPGALYPDNDGAQTELLLLAQDAENEKTKTEQEAVLIAQKILELMAHYQVTDAQTGELRPVRFGDIAILLRAPSGWDEVFSATLKNFGIPAYTASATGYFSSEEIRTILHFLRILDNPLQDIPLFGVLRSPIGSFTENEIAMLRTAKPKATLYEAMQLAVSEKEEQPMAFLQEDFAELIKKSRRFLELLSKYRERMTYEPVRTLIREILEETDYVQYMTAFPQGEVRRANLEMLLKRAADFEKTGTHGLFAFIRYMEQLEKYDVDYGEAGTTDEYADVVRIMSIHKSKGLEFPVCILAGLAKRFNIQDQAKSFLMDIDYGIGCEAVDLERRLRRTTLRRNVIARRQTLDNLGEEIRILYVAMTRAKEKLIMTACLKQPEKKLGALGLYETDEGYCQMQDTVSLLTLAGAGSLLDFLIPAWEPIKLFCFDDLRAEELADTIRGETRLLRLPKEAEQNSIPELQEAFLKRFSYVYPWEALKKLYTKTTVSELKMEKMTDASEGAKPLFDTQRREAYIPRFCRESEKASGAARGSAVHHVMELLDFADPAWESGVQDIAGLVREAISRCLKSGRLERAEADCVNVSKIAAFLLSEAGMRMRRAAKEGILYKEQPFMLGLPASLVDAQFPEGETVLIQGIIDAYWEEADGLVVLDYKTDRVEALTQLAGRYAAQLAYYAEALSQITGKRVKEKLIYSFHFQELLEL